MKRITRNLAIFVIVCVMVLSMVALVACKGSGVYTVKVVGTDGKPYAGAVVQLCKVESSGSLSTCYEGVATDAQGVATLTVGKEIPDKDVDEMEVHLFGLPAYLTADSVRMKKGETVTITLKNNLKSPSGGTGEGSYGQDKLGNDTLTMNPYIVDKGAYELKFTSATQLIFYEFRALDVGIYKVYSVGDVDAAVTQLTGTEMTGIRNTGDPNYTNDNISATDKNFSYEFIVDDSLMEQTKGMNNDINYGACYFEISLKNAEHVNKSAIIVFEYVDEYSEEPPVETVPVNPSKTLTVYGEQDGAYTDLDMDMTCVKGDDGYYHVNDKDGAIVIATLGNDTVFPRVLGMSFLSIYRQGQTLSFYDSVLGKNKDYAPLVEAYTQACNSEGRYPLTDELIDFFSTYIKGTQIEDWLAEELNTLLPEGREWIVWCGYYAETYTGGDGSSEENAIYLTEGVLTISVAAGGSVYYSSYYNPEVTYMITSEEANIKLSVYNAYYPDEVMEYVSSDYSWGLDVYVSASPRSLYYFVFSTEDGAAATYDVTVTIYVAEPEPDGSFDNPFVIDYFGWRGGECTSVLGDGSGEPLYYIYTVSEYDDDGLYFYLGENTMISYVEYVDSDLVPHQLSYDQIKDGLKGLPVETVITIAVGTELGEGLFSFALYNSPLGGKGNAYNLSEGKHTVVVPADGVVYYAVNNYSAYAVNITITSGSTNVSLKAYDIMVGEDSATQVSSSASGFTYTVKVGQGILHYFVFSTVNGLADSYDIEVAEEYIIPEGSWDNPIVIKEFGVQHGEVTEIDWMAIPVYFTFTATENVTLYFALGNNTVVDQINWYHEETEQGEYYCDWENGVQVPAGAVVTIAVVTADGELGPVSFTISNQPINAD
ncbi:MAG: hypothetical protein J1G02_05850 [Clostridiales bacterium]|nr:hypothetical protein [Clostridiales bacterium]